VTSASVRLTRDQLSVDGSLSVSADGLVARFTPVKNLERSSTYSLVVTLALRDLDGEPLDSLLAFEFRTAPTAPTVSQAEIAFVSGRDGNPEIYTANIDGTDVRRLTNTAVAESDPDWSPDGSKLVFARSRTLEAGSESDIYIMDADGSNVVQVTDGGKNFQPAWSPDGTQVAYVTQEFFTTKTKIRVQRLDEDRSIYKDVGMGDLDIGANTHPAWSPDGLFIAYATVWDLFDLPMLAQVRTDGSSAPTSLPLPRSIFYYIRPRWRGSSIAFAECDGSYTCVGPGSIAVIDSDSWVIRRLIRAYNIGGLTWSPYGNFIAYSAQTCRVCTPPSIYYISADGRDRSVMFSNAYSPSWRPTP